MLGLEIVNDVLQIDVPALRTHVIIRIPHIHMIQVQPMVAVREMAETHPQRLNVENSVPFW